MTGLQNLMPGAIKECRNWHSDRNWRGQGVECAPEMEERAKPGLLRSRFGRPFTRGTIVGVALAALPSFHRVKV